MEKACFSVNFNKLILAVFMEYLEKARLWNFTRTESSTSAFVLNNDRASVPLCGHQIHHHPPHKDDVVKRRWWIMNMSYFFPFFLPRLDNKEKIIIVFIVMMIAIYYFCDWGWSVTHYTDHFGIRKFLSWRLCLMRSVNFHFFCYDLQRCWLHG